MVCCGRSLSGGRKRHVSSGGLWKPWNKRILKKVHLSIYLKFRIYFRNSEIITHNSDEENQLAILSFPLGSEYEFISFCLFFSELTNTLLLNKIEI